MVRSRRRASLRRWGRTAANSLAGDLDFELEGMRSFHTSSSWRVLILCGRPESKEINRPGAIGRAIFIVWFSNGARCAKTFGIQKAPAPQNHPESKKTDLRR